MFTIDLANFVHAATAINENEMSRYKVSIPGITDKLKDKNKVEMTTAVSLRKAVLNVVAKAANIIQGKSWYTDGKFSTPISKQYVGLIAKHLFDNPSNMYMEDMGTSAPRDDYKHNSAQIAPTAIKTDDNRVIGKGTEVVYTISNIGHGAPGFVLDVASVDDKSLTAHLQFDTLEDAKEAGWDV